MAIYGHRLPNRRHDISYEDGLCLDSLAPFWRSTTHFRRQAQDFVPLVFKPPNQFATLISVVTGDRRLRYLMRSVSRTPSTHPCRESERACRLPSAPSPTQVRSHAQSSRCLALPLRSSSVSARSPELCWSGTASSPPEPSSPYRNAHGNTPCPSAGG